MGLKILKAFLLLLSVLDGGSKAELQLCTSVLQHVLQPTKILLFFFFVFL